MDSSDAIIPNDVLSRVPQSKPITTSVRRREDGKEWVNRIKLFTRAWRGHWPGIARHSIPSQRYTYVGTWYASAFITRKSFLRASRPVRRLRSCGRIDGSDKKKLRANHVAISIIREIEQLERESIGSNKVSRTRDYCEMMLRFAVEDDSVRRTPSMYTLCNFARATNLSEKNTQRHCGTI